MVLGRFSARRVRRVLWLQKAIDRGEASLGGGRIRRPRNPLTLALSPKGERGSRGKAFGHRGGGVIRRADRSIGAGLRGRIGILERGGAALLRSEASEGTQRRRTDAT